MSQVRTDPAAAASPWVPAGGLLVHVGPHKTGTTTVQEAFAARRDELAARGIVYPGPYPADHDAVRSRLGTPGGWDDAVPPPHRATWGRLKAQTREVDATVVVSSEAFCHATTKQAAAVCEDLRPGRAHRAVVTVRPFCEVVPSAWQEYVKAGWTTDFDTFLRSVLIDGPGADGPTPTFWIRHDHGAVTRRWATALGAESVAVIVANRNRPAKVLAAFEELVGLERGFLPRDLGVANRSLSVPEIELLRAVNQRLRPVLGWESYTALVRMGALPALLDRRSLPDDEQRLALPEWADVMAQEAGRRSAKRIRSLGVPVFGELRRLREGGRTSELPVRAEAVARDVVDVFAGGMIDAAAVRFEKRSGTEMVRRDVDAVVAAMTTRPGPVSTDRAAQVLADLAVDLASELGEVPS